MHICNQNGEIANSVGLRVLLVLHFHHINTTCDDNLITSNHLINVLVT